MGNHGLNNVKRRLQADASLDRDTVRQVLFATPVELPVKHGGLSQHASYWPWGD